MYALVRRTHVDDTATYESWVSDMSWGLFVSVCLIDRAAKQGGIKVTKRYLRS